jgi:hypothetical protein
MADDGYSIVYYVGMVGGLISTIFALFTRDVASFMTGEEGEHLAVDIGGSNRPFLPLFPKEKQVQNK